MFPLLLSAILVTLHAAPGAAPAEASPGRRLMLTDGQIFIPEDFRLGGEAGVPVPLMLHLHGSASAAERNLLRSRQPGVGVTVILPGLSAAYSQKFRDPAVFRRILDETRSALAGAPGAPEVRLGPVTVTSFSAGFGGVRELLKDTEAFARIDALVMADSIYAGFVGDPAKRELDPANMEGFLRFAREAAEGKKRMLVTYTRLGTPTYASTMETAAYLIRMLGGQRETVSESWPGALQLQSRFRRGRLQVLGFDGETGADHMKHLRELWVFLEKMRED